MTLNRTEKLTMNRSGEFVFLTWGNSHCGIKKNIKVKYAVKAECTARLDGRGFLFDQITVDNFFQSIRDTRLSCEELSMFCTDGLMEVIHKENPSCQVKKMSLTLSPEPFLASMTHDCEWS